VLSFLIYEFSGLSLLKASNSNESTSKFFKSVIPLECFASFQGWSAASHSSISLFVFFISMVSYSSTFID
jgi:hypothetical protein